MANRHKHHKKARGGEMSARDDYAGSGEPNVVKEAKEKNHGGGVEMGKVHGHKGKHRSRFMCRQVFYAMHMRASHGA